VSAERLNPVIVAVAEIADVAGFLALAAQVEDWFGPMVDEPGFHHALERNIRRGTAMCVRRQDGTGLRGGILFNIRPPVCRVSWLVVAQADRGLGVGQALVTEAVHRLDSPGLIEVITFSEDHPAAEPSGARKFYERLGFIADEAAEAGPDGTPRQWYRKRLNT
jgi:GNAT superfamily N-acetyltransferase